jgi:hypothetical protein
MLALNQPKILCLWCYQVLVRHRLDLDGLLSQATEQFASKSFLASTFSLIRRTISMSSAIQPRTSVDGRVSPGGMTVGACGSVPPSDLPTTFKGTSVAGSSIAPLIQSELRRSHRSIRETPRRARPPPTSDTGMSTICARRVGLSRRLDGPEVDRPRAPVVARSEDGALAARPVPVLLVVHGVGLLRDEVQLDVAAGRDHIVRQQGERHRHGRTFHHLLQQALRVGHAPRLAPNPGLRVRYSRMRPRRRCRCRGPPSGPR